MKLALAYQARNDTEVGLIPVAGAAVDASTGALLVPESAPEPKTRRNVVDELVRRFDEMIAQCLYCLSGVQLCEPPRQCGCRKEGDAAGDLSSVAACADLWVKIEPYTTSLSLDKVNKFKLNKLLEPIRAAFPPESAAPRGGNPVEKYLAALPGYLDAGVSEPFSPPYPPTFVSLLGAEDASRGAAGRDEERRCAKAAVDRPPPALRSLLGSGGARGGGGGGGRGSDDAMDALGADAVGPSAAAGTANGEGGGCGGGGGGDANMTDADVRAEEDDEEGGEGGGGGNMWAGLADLMGNVSTHAGVRAAAGGGVGMQQPTPLMSIKRRSHQDPAAEFTDVHQTLHYFCATQIDYDFADCKWLPLTSTFPLVIDLLRACFPRPAGERAPPPLPPPPLTPPAAEAQGEPVADMAARQAALLKADLVHSPRRFDGWYSLVVHLDAVKDIALNDAAKMMLASQWARSSEAAALVARLQLALRRACCAAIAAASTDTERASAYERAGLAAYELVQEAPPFHDGRLARRAHDARWRVALGLCLEVGEGCKEDGLLETVPFELANSRYPSKRLHTHRLVPFYDVLNASTRCDIGVPIQGRSTAPPLPLRTSVCISAWAPRWHARWALLIGTCCRGCLRRGSASPEASRRSTRCTRRGPKCCSSLSTISPQPQWPLLSRQRAQPAAAANPPAEASLPLRQRGRKPCR